MEWVGPIPVAMHAVLQAVEVRPTAAKHLACAVGRVVVVAQDGKAAQPRPGKGVEQCEHVGHPAVIVQEITRVYQDVVFHAAASPADVLDFGLLAPV